jgi:lysophospholipase L1-like esterase
MVAPDAVPASDRARAGAGDVDPGGAAGRDRPRRWPAAVAFAGWLALIAFAGGEVMLRSASRFGLLLFDTEMWRYAKDVKRPSPSPGVVIEHRPDAAATLMGVRVRTDARGFRRPAPALEAARTGDERVVAVVGDSCAFGWGVPEGQTLAEHLERRLDALLPASRRVAVVNAGVGNSNTAMEYARYRRDVRPLRPAWVVLAYFINDAEPDPQPTLAPALAHSVLLATVATRLPSLLAPSPRDYRRYYASLYAPDSPGVARFREALRRFGATLREDGVPGTVLLVPEMHEPRGFGPFAAIYRDVAALATASGFEVVDPSGAFPPGSGQAYWVTPGDTHPDGAAHDLFAAALVRSAHARHLVEGPRRQRTRPGDAAAP